MLEDAEAMSGIDLKNYTLFAFETPWLACKAVAQAI
jgi:hypothetical protein